MPAIQIRDVPEELYERLRKASEQHHRSIAGEALTILEAALGEQRPYERHVFEAINTVREKIERTYGSSSSSVPLIREDRDR